MPKQIFSLLAGSFFGFAFNAGPSQMQSLWTFLVVLLCPCQCLKILRAVFLFSDSVSFSYILTTHTYCLYKHIHIQMYSWRLLWKMWRKQFCGIPFYYCMILHLMASSWRYFICIILIFLSMTIVKDHQRRDKWRSTSLRHGRMAEFWTTFFFFLINFTRWIPLQHCIGQKRKPTVILNLLELCEMGLPTFHTDWRFHIDSRRNMLKLNKASTLYRGVKGKAHLRL